MTIQLTSPMFVVGEILLGFSLTMFIGLFRNSWASRSVDVCVAKTAISAGTGVLSAITSAGSSGRALLQARGRRGESIGRARALFVSSFGLRHRLLAAVAEIVFVRLHAVSDRALARLDVGAELLDVGLTGLGDRSGADDRHLTVGRQVGKMRLHASLELAAAGLYGLCPPAFFNEDIWQNVAPVDVAPTG